MRNIVLITIDTLRKDHCNCYGYFRDTTPFLNKISKAGVKFEYAFANGPLTPRSFPSILCGCHAFDGKEDDIGSYFLPKDVETTPQKLKKLGYFTAAFQAGNPLTSSFYGYNRGFDFFEDFLKGSFECDKIEKNIKKRKKTNENLFSKFWLFLNSSPIIKNMAKKVYQSYILYKKNNKYLKKLKNNEIPFIRGGKLNETVLNWLEKYSKKQPLFLWIHYMDVHPPWIPKEDISKSLDIPMYADKIIAGHWSEITNHQIKNSEQIRELKDLYDCEIRYENKCVRELFDILEKNNLTKENTFFILTADHGEEFGEHGGLGHELKLYNEMLSVPLIFLGKGSEEYAKFSDSLLELKDIPQVILDVAEEGKITDISKDYVLSQSLRRVDKNWVKLIALQTKKFKLICDTGLKANNEFYDISNDPYEKDNLINNRTYSEMINKFNAIINKFLKNNYYKSKIKKETITKIDELKKIGRI